MKQYLDLLKSIKNEGTPKPAARANMPGSKSLFGPQFEVDLQDGFPALTTKTLYWKGVVVELLWMLKGITNIKYLVDNKVNIWNEDAYNYYIKQCDKQGLLDRYSLEDFVSAVANESLSRPFAVPPNYTLGDCGKQYGYQWRNFGGKTDQLSDLINGLKDGPTSRRHIITAWNPGDMDNLALHPCHAMVQFNCRPMNVTERCDNVGLDIKDFKTVNLTDEVDDNVIHDRLDASGVPKYLIDCKLYQRSGDAILGIPFNIASYALLTHIFATLTNMIPGKFTHSFGDAHIYDNHEEALTEQLKRVPDALPTLKVDERLIELSNKLLRVNSGVTIEEAIEELQPEWFILNNYKPQGKIKAKLSTGLK